MDVGLNVLKFDKQVLIVIWYASFQSDSICFYLASVLNCFEEQQSSGT